ncbi:MAG TPA: trypsin-like peptidase domain-containing protein [Candidatus Hydrogenedentes bacterium]|nr:trypsin-like peptidase domain-containing protein [Candidatus Hydrogenedentota bacterium]HOJ68022.1 trypsin-like peptidase domain-containing protein [Candidatus Hydrogenedentota bacterium]HOK90096.1 trypsin-like peptidase domain-containing protein [Candidatus Hydrogenedentota bacterium]
MRKRFPWTWLTVVIGAVALAAPVFAQSDIDASRNNAIVRAIEKAAPAVVTINVVSYQRETVLEPLFEDFWGLFGPPLARRQVRQRAVSGIGSGFIYDDAGHILTNYHVLQGADAISSVVLPDGRRLDVEVVGGDERSDIAVLRVKGDVSNLPRAQLGDSDTLRLGEWVIAIGNPFGMLMRDSQPSVSVGVVSAVHRKVSRTIGDGERLYQDLIQTDAAINPGNSGGPLVDASGKVVGINTMIFSNSGGYQGLGFALPINRVKRVADELIRYGRRRDPWFGFRGQAIAETDPYTLSQLGIVVDTGVLVTEVVKDSPSAKAGLRPGDVVLAINGEVVEHPLDVDFINWALFVGDAAVFDVVRGGKTTRLTLKLEEFSG